MALSRRSAVGVILGLLMLPEAWAGPRDLDASQRLIDEGRLNDAVEVLSSHLETGPGEAEAYRLRALALSGLGRFDEAVQDYEKIIEDDPEDAESHFDLGMILALKKKDASHALVHLDRYLALQDDSEKAEKVARLMVSVDSKRSRFDEKAVEDLLEMARKFASDGKVRIAMQAYERALRIHPTCAECHESLGRLLLQERNDAEGNRHIARAKLFRSDG